jgi:hypothetical protein
LAIFAAIRRASWRMSDFALPLYDFPGKFFDERTSRYKIGKAPTSIGLALPDTSATLPDSNVSRIVEVQYAAVQFEIIGISRKLDDIGVFNFVA